ncbi:hypothetical protein [Marinomonas fungiae]|uniref:hypothetical protein n=1 Tax=Marinomonas fungiae TaxID=1137284 RepID=UPI003A8F06E2
MSTLKAIKNLKSQGNNKETIFLTAVDQGHDPKVVAKALSSYPDDDEAKRYHVANLILIGIYTLLVLINMLSYVFVLPQLSSPDIYWLGLGICFGLGVAVTIILCLWQKVHIGYIFMVCMLLFGWCQAAKYATFDEALFDLLIALCLVAYALKLKACLFPYQNLLHNKVNAEGAVIYSKLSAQKAQEVLTEESVK